MSRLNGGGECKEHASEQLVVQRLSGGRREARKPHAYRRDVRNSEEDVQHEPAVAARRDGEVGIAHRGDGGADHHEDK